MLSSVSINPDTLPSTSSDALSFVRKAGANLTSILVGRLAGIGTLVILSRRLSHSDLAAYFIISSLSSFAVEVGLFGGDRISGRRLAAQDASYGGWRAGVRLSLVGLPCAGILASLIYHFGYRSHSGHSSLQLLTLFSVTVFFDGLLRVSSEILKSSHAVFRANIATPGIRALFGFVFLCAFSLFRIPLTIGLALAVAALAGLCTFSLSLLGPPIILQPKSTADSKLCVRWRHTVVSGALITINAGSVTVINVCDLLIIGMLASNDTTRYGLALRVVSLTNLVPMAINFVSGPQIARLAASGDRAGLLRYVNRLALRHAIGVAIPYLVILGSGDRIFRVLGGEAADGARPIALILGLGSLVAAPLVAKGSALLYVAEDRRLAMAAAFVLPVAIISEFIAAKTARANGVAVASAGSSILLGLAYGSQWQRFKRMRGV